MEEFWVQLLAILTLLTQTSSPSDTTQLIGAVGGSVNFRIQKAEGNAALWSFGNEPIVTVEFQDPPQFIFLKEEFKTRFTVSEGGRALSISQLRTEDAGTYSVTINRKISTFTLLVYRELPEPTVTCESLNCSGAVSSPGVGIGIGIGAAVGVLSTFLVFFCKSQGFWQACMTRLASGSSEISATAGPGHQGCVQAMRLLGPEPGPALDQHGTEPGPALDQFRPGLRQSSPVPAQITDGLRPVPGLAMDQRDQNQDWPRSSSLQSWVWSCTSWGQFPSKETVIKCWNSPPSGLVEPPFLDMFNRRLDVALDART